jgi:hypothetical protein
MKKFYFILCLAIALLTQLQAQAPQGFNYQATVRNSSGDLIVNTNVYFKFNIMQGSQTSVPVYSETHYAPTDDLGQITLVIGQGTATEGVFSELDWSLGSYYLGIELDTGSGYVAMGTTQLLSVPYALYAENSGNSTPTTPNLETVLAENNSANNQQIKDLQDPTDAQDAVTLAYVSVLEAQIEEINLNIDHDGDGFTENQGDCNDDDVSIHPSAIEVEDDGIDNNCDGQVDEIIDQNEIDNDNDGFTENQGDCDDSNPNINPNSIEIQDGLDNNCDGSIDEIPSAELDDLNDLLSQINSGEVQLITIGQLKAQFNSGDDATEITSDIAVKGYVSSSDASVNFYKEFFIQNTAENPTDAVKISLNQVDSYNQFNIGREVYVSLKNLYLGEANSGDGVFTIGSSMNGDGEVESLNANEVAMYLFRSSTTEIIVPKDVTSLSSDDIGIFITVNNVEFIENEIGQPYVSPTDDYDTERTIQRCSDFEYTTFKLQTSAFALFQNNILPSGGGSISGIVSKTYNGSDLVLKLNSINNVQMDSNRCQLLDINDFSPIFEDDFESYTNYSNILGQWTNYAEEGSLYWRANTSYDNQNSGSKIAYMSAYNSGDSSNIVWLITPVIDLDAQGAEFVNFKSSQHYVDDCDLQLLISTNWDGNENSISTSTWEILNANISSDSDYWQNWVDSGLTDLSSYSGNAYIAIKYIGSNDPNYDGTFEIDDFQVLVQN